MKDTNMRKLTYVITDNGKTYYMEFITDRTPQWTESQYTRHRLNCKMELISDEPTTETKPITRKIDN